MTISGAKIEVLRTLVEGGRSYVLRRRGAHLELVTGNVLLLSDAALETERAFGALAARAPGPRPRVLVGGLGFGATAAGALAAMPPEGELVVVERVEAVAGVAREHAEAKGWVDDPRVRLVHDDVGAVIAREADSPADDGGLSAILLDVDNGPEWASFRDNARLYTTANVARAAAALRPGGLYAVWSGYPKDAFTQTLREAGLEPEIVPLVEMEGGRSRVRARAYVGKKPG